MDTINSMLPMWKLRDIRDKVTNVVMNFTEPEIKVREATNDEHWGPHGSLMQEISQYTLTYEHYNEVMSMLWKRMFQEKENWRATYKSLILLNHLIKNGSEKVVTSSREHMYDLKSLENFSYHDEKGKDQGINIRVKVKEIIEFIQDDDRLREERQKAKKNRDKYVGIDSFSRSSNFSSSFSGGINDYSRSGFGSSGGFGNSEFGDYKKSNMPDLNDQEWRSSNPSIKDRITDITSKVKTMMDQPPDNDHNLDISDGENDLGIVEKNVKKVESPNKIVLKPMPKSPSTKTPSKNNVTVNNAASKKDNAPDLLNLDNDDFADFVSHRIVATEGVKTPSPVKPVNNVKNNEPPVKSNVDLLGIDIPSSESQPTLDLFQNNTNQNQDLFGSNVNNSGADLFNLDNTNENIFGNNTISSNQNNANIDLFSLGSPVNKSMPSSMTMPNLYNSSNIGNQNLSSINEDLFGFTNENKSESVQSFNKAPNNNTLVNTSPALNKTGSMWDDLSKSVDINLDNLSPYNKGAKNKQNNISMNNMMQNKKL